MSRRTPQGQPAKPSQLHIVDGTTPSNDRSAEPTPDLLTEVPPVPPGLGRWGKQKWPQLAAQLISQRLLSVADLDMLEQACRAYQLLVTAENRLHQRGLTYNAGTREQPQYRPRPEVAIARDAAARFRSALREFGQSPSSRASVSAPPAPADLDPAEAFLARGRSDT